MSISDIETHELYIEDPTDENSPPMFGGLCCRIAAMPYCCEEPIWEGLVSMSSKSSPKFASLMDWKLSLWNSPEQKVAARRPVLVIGTGYWSCLQVFVTGPG